MKRSLLPQQQYNHCTQSTQTTPIVLHFFTVSRHHSTPIFVPRKSDTDGKSCLGGAALTVVVISTLPNASRVENVRRRGIRWAHRRCVTGAFIWLNAQRPLRRRPRPSGTTLFRVTWKPAGPGFDSRLCFLRFFAPFVSLLSFVGVPRATSSALLRFLTPLQNSSRVSRLSPPYFGGNDDNKLLRIWPHDRTVVHSDCALRRQRRR